MKPKNLIFLIFLISLTPKLRAQDDLQLWSAFSWKLHQANKYDLNLYVENRAGDDISESLAYFLGPTVGIPLNKNFAIGAAVKQIYLKSNSEWDSWQRTELDATYKLKLGLIKFDHRTRHEYFFRDQGSDFQRYRSRLKFSLPLKGRLTAIGLSNEFFYDQRTNDFAINRLIPLSLTFKLPKGKSLNTSYLWEHRRSGSRENHVISTTLFF